MCYTKPNVCLILFPYMPKTHSRFMAIKQVDLCWRCGLCYSSPFDVILKSACQCCLEIKKVFSARANCSGLSDTFRMSGGSLFHWFDPDTEKLRLPNRSALACGATRSPWSVVRSVTLHPVWQFSIAVMELLHIEPQGCKVLIFLWDSDSSL